MRDWLRRLFPPDPPPVPTGECVSGFCAEDEASAVERRHDEVSEIARTTMHRAEEQTRVSCEVSRNAISNVLSRRARRRMSAGSEGPR